jgi:hypothetical protein
MDLSFYALLSITLPIVLLLGIIIVKLIKNKQLPDSRYTPFDFITGQTNVEFHEEKEAVQEEDDQGEGKNPRNKMRIRLPDK